MVWCWYCQLPVAFAVVGWVVSKYGEQIAASLDAHGDGEARRRRFPPGAHAHPTPVLAPPASGSARLAWSSGLHELPGGRRLWWQRIAPRAAAPRGIVVFVHGVGEHSDFALFNAARAFVQHSGCSALLVDLPGHGRSDGLHGLVEDWAASLEALWHWCDAVCAAERRGALAGGAPTGAAAAREAPLFAFGSAMGGAIALGMALRRPSAFDGLMLVAPTVRLAERVRLDPWWEALLAWCEYLPLVRHLPLLRGTDLASLHYAQDAAWRLDEDRRLNALHYWGRLRPQTARSLLVATDSIAAQLDNVTSPLLVLHGADDLTSAPDLSEELVRRAVSSDKTLQLVPSAMHGLHYGESPETMRGVYQTMFDWLDRRMLPRRRPPGEEGA